MLSNELKPINGTVDFLLIKKPDSSILVKNVIWKVAF